MMCVGETITGGLCGDKTVTSALCSGENISGAYAMTRLKLAHFATMRLAADMAGGKTGCW
ncbi:conserved hypothetical protein [Ricinus communis]|uniref:Uncharacterized protein n=1 Tax=Ricinus communis TaxID=3988 RepID=B9SH47_RICCO|nr:conserved hypothetical protein [Ricinus communis]